MVAPGGRALAGYPDPHAHCIPVNFESIQNTIGMASVNRLIDEIFVNDVEHLNRGGKLYQVTLTCVACLVGAYNKLYTDLKSAFEETPSYGVGPDNNAIMIAIREAAKRAKIEDPTIAEIPNVPRYIVVLRGWSRQVTDAHRRNNPDRVAQSASLSQHLAGYQTQLVDILGAVKGLEQRSDGRVEDRMTIEILQEQLGKQDIMIASMKAKDLEKDKLITRLKNANLALQGSPPRRRKRPLEDDDNEDKEEMGGEEEMVEDLLGERGVESVVQSQTLYDTASTAAAATALAPEIMIPSLPVWGLNGIQLTKLNPSNVTITTELERLAPILMQKQEQAVNAGTTLSKRALFDPINKYFIGCNEHFSSKDASKYRDAMKLIAISITNSNWSKLIVIGRKSGDGSHGDDRPMRDLVSVIKRSTLDTLKRLQTDYLNLDPGRKSRAKDGIRGLGDNARAVFNKALKGKAIVEQEEWLADKLGEGRQSGEQLSLQAAFSNSDKA